MPAQPPGERERTIVKHWISLSYYPYVHINVLYIDIVIHTYIIRMYVYVHISTYVHTYAFTYHIYTFAYYCFCSVHMIIFTQWKTAYSELLCSCPTYICT